MYFSRLHPVVKLMASLLVGILAFYISYSVDMEYFTRLMIGWNFFGLVYILFSLYTMFKTKTDQIRVIAQRQDIGHQLLFVLLVMASLGCMIVIALLIRTSKNWILDKNMITLIYLGGVTICWILLQILFTFHYAHIFYGDASDNKSKHRGGLNFPGNKLPDYLDFAYFSFVIGMTFQVSDVSIVEQHFRRISLLHALLAFVFNTVIVALSINAILDRV